jgi:hypothetical protein
MFDVPFAPDSPICPRCHEPVRLEDAKSDETVALFTKIAITPP